nr:terpene synthase-like protein uBuTS-9 [Bubarida sp. uBuTS-9]
MSLFAEVPIKALPLERPLQYAHSALNLARLRKASESVCSSLTKRLQKHCSALKLNPQYIEAANFSHFAAKVYNIGVATEPGQDRLGIFVATLALFVFEFDDHFDKPCGTPENVSRLSMEMRILLRALSRHGLAGLQGVLDDWPTGAFGREAYLWLLKEAEDLRKGAAELMHYSFLDYCFGVESEILEWAPDAYRGDTTAWNLDRYSEVRKRSVGVTITLVAPLYIINKWTKKEHFATCNDLLYNAALIGALANDVLGMKRDQEESQSLGMTALKIVSASEAAQYHNEKVECLKKDILDLDGDTRRLMEEVEVINVAQFLWQCNARRYN